MVKQVTKYRRTIAMPWLVAFCLVGSVMPPAWATDGDQSAGAFSDEEFRLPLDDKTAEEVDELMELLGSPVYREREAATTRLAEIGVATFAKLRQAYSLTDDVEVRLRIEALVYRGFLDFRVFNRNGFLGIQQELSALTHGDDPRIGQGQLGIRIKKVIPDTAAAKAKIKKGDVIVQLNGEPLRVQDEQPTVLFGEQLRKMGPGTRIKLRVLRSSKTLEIEATLGRRLKEYYIRRSTSRDILYEARGNFEPWWVHHFRQQQAMGDDD